MIQGKQKPRFSDGDRGFVISGPRGDAYRKKYGIQSDNKSTQSTTQITKTYY